VSTKTTSPPETKRQAQRWDAHVKAYRALGLCVACAGQAAYGHQLGFDAIAPPCETCRPLVNASAGERLGRGWRSMVAETVAEKWLSAIEAKRASFRVLAVARLIAEHADDDGLAQVSRRFIEKTAHAGAVIDNAKGLKTLLGSGWLVTFADADQATRTPRTFQLATPVRDLGAMIRTCGWSSAG
jgi:hypothetical protein